MTRRVLLITGSYPPDVCGVGDYTKKLYENSLFDGKWDLFYSSKWGVRTLIQLYKKSRSGSYSTVVIQYPTNGYGWSIVPHLVCILLFFTKINVIAVLHEYSQLSFKAKFLSLCLIWFSTRVVVTSSYERDAILHICKRNKINIIKIASNIAPQSNLQFDCTLKIYDVCYFGLIRPNKGIEDFVTCCKALKNKSTNFNFLLIGKVPVGCELYFRTILQSLENSSIIYQTDCDEKQVASLLENSKITFLPYPDGISDRRGSFLAANCCGSVVVSYHGPYETEELNQGALLVHPARAMETLYGLLSNNKALQLEQERQKIYLDNYQNTWRDIYNSYINLIEEIDD